MSQSRLVELVVGLFVCIGVAAAFFLTFQVSDFSEANDDTYIIKGAFTNVKGVKKGTAVDISGVIVGRVTDIEVQTDKEYNTAMNRVFVSMAINDKYKLATNTEAKILTAGLLGEKYIGLIAGDDEETLKNGEFVAEAHSTLIFEEVIGQVVAQMADKDTGPTETDKKLAELLERLSKQNVGN